ncbi:hypothetical protein V1507DRAFT_451060, partial [Lipomyces tetrasporus]
VHADAISITDEPWIARILSKTVTGRDDFFRARVRERDGKCVITGVVNAGAYRNDWVGFETARIFPLSSEEYWVQSGYSTWITKREGERDTINSPQNGLLCSPISIRNLILSVSPSTDMMGDILGGPEAGKRMEAELFSRLNGQFLV